MSHSCQPERYNIRNITPAFSVPDWLQSCSEVPYGGGIRRQIYEVRSSKQSTTINSTTAPAAAVVDQTTRLLVWEQGLGATYFPTAIFNFQQSYRQSTCTAAHTTDNYIVLSKSYEELRDCLRMCSALKTKYFVQVLLLLLYRSHTDEVQRRTF